jgi:hypothetical protein
VPNAGSEQLFVVDKQLKEPDNDIAPSTHVAPTAVDGFMSNPVGQEASQVVPC